MTVAFIVVSAANACLWAFVLRDWSRFRRWMADEDARDRDQFKGLGQLRTELQQARDELRDARGRLDWAVDQIIERMPD